MGPKKQQPAIKKRDQKQNSKDVHNSIFVDGEDPSRT